MTTMATTASGTKVAAQSSVRESMTWSKKLLASLCLLVSGSAPMAMEAQIPSPGEIDVTGRVFTKIVAKVVGEAAESRPVADLKIYVVTERGDRVTLRTNSSGVATTWLRKAHYRFVTPDPVVWNGRVYSWDLIAPVAAGMGPIKFNPSNATRPTAAAPSTPSVGPTSAPRNTAGLSNPATASPPIVQVVSLGPMVRWDPAVANSDQVLKEGRVVRILVRDGVAVSASLVRSEDLIWVNVAVSNRSNRRIDVDPERFTLSEVTPKQVPLRYRSPADLAKSINRRAQVGAAISLIAGELSKMETTTEVSTTGSATTTGTYDTRATVTGLDPLAGARISGSTTGRSSTTLRSQTSIRTSEPDEVARARAAGMADDIMGNASMKVSEILKRALLANTLMPGEDIAGSVFFERDKKARDVLLRLPLSWMTFEIPLRAK